ncbi:hypothetical protein Tco_0625218 [Tanacetum coccineum]|uniref:Uncharacterized protein n=1 Tax=Tanacetum coccineum TaxID=301880 RepID=A0ABQ4WG59_9ASTR
MLRNECQEEDDELPCDLAFLMEVVGVTEEEEEHVLRLGLQDPSPRGRILLSDSLLNSFGKDQITPQRYPNFPTTSWRISIRSMDSFQGLTPKSPVGK